MYRGEIPGYVVLKDGTVFKGFGFGAEGQVLGEAVFNTSMSGYQEVVTDPSYYGQMVTFTYPMIGNYGSADHLLESANAHSRAIIVREAKNTAWNATCPEAWLDWLTARGIVGVGGIDTAQRFERNKQIVDQTGQVGDVDNAVGRAIGIAADRAATRFGP